MPTPRELFDRHVRLTEAGDLEGVLGQYHDDAVLLRFDRVVHGRAALRDHYASYLASGPRFKEILQVAEAEDLVSWQAVLEQGGEEHRDREGDERNRDEDRMPLPALEVAAVG